MKKHTTLLILMIFTAMLVLSGCTSKTGGGSTAAEGNTPAAQSEATEVNLGALKGPTSIGIMDLVKKSAAGEGSALLCLDQRTVMPWLAAYWAAVGLVVMKVT